MYLSVLHAFLIGVETVKILTKSGVYLIGVESSGSPVQIQLQHNPILILSSYLFCFEISDFSKFF